MTLEQAIRAVIGTEATESEVLTVAYELTRQGTKEPMPRAIAAAADVTIGRGITSPAQLS